MSERKVVDYKVVKGITGFDDKIREALADGWQPLGGVTMYLAECAQAMVKYE